MPTPNDLHRLWSILWKKESSLTAVGVVARLPEPQTQLTLQPVTIETINPLSGAGMPSTNITTWLPREVELREPQGTTYHPTLYLASVALTLSTQVKN